MQNIKHHFIGNISIHENFSAGDFMRQARTKISDILQTKDKVIVTGGTGLYIKALLNGINEFPDVSFNTLHELEQEVEKDGGLESLQKELQLKDPLLFLTIDKYNKRRVMRALSIIRESGKPYTFFSNKPTVPINFPYQYFVISREREELYNRINLRVDQMMKDGLLAEAKTLHPLKHLRSLQTVGYQELFEYLDDNYTLEFAINKIKQHSRNYAKRQLTWFNGVEEAVSIDAKLNILEQINEYI
jgi:tRNA dimethylallyltransferase